MIRGLVVTLHGWVSLRPIVSRPLVRDRSSSFFRTEMGNNKHTNTWSIHWRDSESKNQKFYDKTLNLIQYGHLTYRVTNSVLFIIIHVEIIVVGSFYGDSTLL